MALKKALSEILEEAAQIVDTKERVAYLQANDSTPLRTLLQYGLDSRAKWLLPEGPIEYKPNKEYPDLQGMLYPRVRTLYLFVEGDRPAQQTISQEKRLKLFRDLLETVLPSDAEMLLRIKDKQFWKTINKNVVNRAFHGLIQ